MNSAAERINLGRLSLILATILLAYSLTPYVSIPSRELNLELAGFLFLLRVDYTGLVSILAAGLGATGMSWLLHDRQPEGNARVEIQHFLLPALTAWALGVPLGALEINLQWWVVFIFGGLLLAAVFYSEYIVVDIEDARSPLAIIGLTSVGYAIYLVLCVALRGAGLRLYLFLPVLFFTAGMVSWRILKLRLVGKMQIHWTMAAAFLTTQAAIGLHYLPVTPIQFGLILTGLCYSANSLAILFAEQNKPRHALLEPISIITLSLILAFLLK